MEGADPSDQDMTLATVRLLVDAQCVEHVSAVINRQVFELGANSPGRPSAGPFGVGFQGLPAICTVGLFHQFESSD